mgnify:CR=1 FL=1
MKTHWDDEAYMRAGEAWRAEALQRGQLAWFVDDPSNRVAKNGGRGPRLHVYPDINFDGSRIARHSKQMMLAHPVTIEQKTFTSIPMMRMPIVGDAIVFYNLNWRGGGVFGVRSVKNRGSHYDDWLDEHIPMNLQLLVVGAKRYYNDDAWRQDTYLLLPDGPRVVGVML